MNTALKKIIFGVLILILAVEVVWAVKTLTTDGKQTKKTAVATIAPQKSATTSPVAAAGAKLSFVPAKVSFKTGQISTLDVILETGQNKIKAVGLDISYDPKKLEIIKITPIGKTFEKILINKIDAKNGKIILSMTQNANSVPVTGKIVMANIGVKAVGTGTAELIFNYKGIGETSDSNVIETEKIKDVLETVEKAILTITQ